jgi:choline dehydrogenase-like flavoprotein
MAASPDCGIASAYLQRWQMPTLFVHGSSPSPNQSSASPTPTILAFTHRTADTILVRYLNKPGMLS